MRFLAFILLFHFLSIKLPAQFDSSRAKKITVSGFCLCETSFDELAQIGNPISIEVEEMDLGKKCLSEDGRFENGEGYYLSKYPGLIFQKNFEGHISKIRLTHDFAGNLPDGTPVNLKHLLLKDIVNQYPQPAFKWGSRDCSDYWTYTNDTIYFYLKIDRNKQPQYPLDVDYYINRPVDAIDIIVSCYGIYHKETFSLFSPDEPMYYIDNIRTNRAMLESYNPTDIAFISVYKDSNTIELRSTGARNGSVYVFTKSFARRHYRDYFESKSAEYKKYIPDEKADAKAVYILNGKVLEKNAEGDLFPIDDSNFEELRIIDAKTLQTDYHISHKKIGVVIKTKANQTRF